MNPSLEKAESLEQINDPRRYTNDPPELDKREVDEIARQLKEAGFVYKLLSDDDRALIENIKEATKLMTPQDSKAVIAKVIDLMQAEHLLATTVTKFHHLFFDNARYGIAYKKFGLQKIDTRLLFL